MPDDQQTKPERSAGGHMFHGSVWMIALRWAIRLTGLVSTVILARLLSPADFGIVAMAMFVVGMLEILNQSGQKLVIIRHLSPSREDYDTAWTMTVIVGLLIGVAIVFLAPLASFFFHEPRVVPVMRWLALRSVIGGFENIGTVNFRRDLKFNRFFLYNVYPKLISFFVTVGLAFLWRNYWALVAGIISSQLAMNVLGYAMHPYRPRFSLAKLPEMLSFSSWTLFKMIGNYLNFQVDQIVVGGLFGSGAMGRYAIATDVASSPSKEINDPMVAVLYPVMATVQKTPAVVRSLYLRVFGWSAIICLSASVGVALVANDMVHLVLGAKWADVVPLMGWLALSAGLLGLSSGAYTTFDTIGKPHLGAQMQWTRLIFLIVALITVSFFLRSSEAIAIARFAVTIIFIPTLLTTIGREIGVSFMDYVGALWRPALAAGAMGAVLYFVNRVLPPSNLRLFVDVFAGGSIFGGVLLGAWSLGNRPESPERDIVEFLQQAPRMLIRRVPQFYR